MLWIRLCFWNNANDSSVPLFTYSTLTHCLYTLYRIANTSSPHWVSVIVLEYQLGTPMIVAVQIYDQKHKQQPVGTVTFDVGECLGTRGNTKAKKMKQGGT